MPLPQDVVDALPEGYRDHSIVKESADVASVVKMAIDSQKELGARIRVPGPDADPEARTAFQRDLMSKVPGLTVIPGEGATDEARAAFYEAIGRPKEAKGYSVEGLKLPEGLPEDFKLPQDRLDKFKEFAHKQGLTQAQFAASLEIELEAMAQGYQSQSRAAQERQAKLDEAWGAAKEAKRNAALKAAEAFGGADFRAQLEANGSPEEWAAWAKAGETFAEGGSINITGAGPQTQFLAPDEARRRMNEVYQNHDHAYHKTTRPGHADAVFEMYNLRLQAGGAKPLTRAQYDAQFGRGGKFNSQDLGTTVAEVGG